MMVWLGPAFEHS